MKSLNAELVIPYVYTVFYTGQSFAAQSSTNFSSSRVCNDVPVSPWVILGAHRMRLRSHNPEQLSKLLCRAALLPEPPSVLHGAVTDSVRRTEKMPSLMKTYPGRKAAQGSRSLVRPGAGNAGSIPPQLHSRRGTERGLEVA